MSKKIKTNINCPVCKNVFPAELYRSIWVEDARNRSLILSDKINAVTCPQCKYHERLQFPFLCTNVKQGFALWYEPYHDPQVDKDAEDYRKQMGPDSFYANAPRISDWKAFKEKLLEMEAETSKEDSVSSIPPKADGSHHVDSDFKAEEADISDKEKNSLNTKILPKRPQRPFLKRYKTMEEYDQAMLRYNQVMKHLSKGQPRGEKKAETSQDSRWKFYDPENSKIILDKNGAGFQGGMACHIVNIIRKSAITSRTPSLITDSNILDRWLGSQGRELNQEDCKRIAKAYIAYVRFGNSTALERKVAFGEKERELDVNEEDLPPQEVQDVFHRMSTPEEDDLNGIKNEDRRKPSKKNAKEYPKTFIHLRSKKGRVFWSFGMFFLFNVFLFIERGAERFLRMVKQDSDYVIVMLGVTFFSFVAFTVLNIAINEIYIVWNTSRELRLRTFGGICWFVFVLIFVLLFDPYNTGDSMYIFTYLSSDEQAHLLSIMFVPPALLIAIRAWYVKHIR